MHFYLTSKRRKEWYWLDLTQPFLKKKPYYITFSFVGKATPPASALELSDQLFGTLGNYSILPHTWGLAVLRLLFDRLRQSAPAVKRINTDAVMLNFHPLICAKTTFIFLFSALCGLEDCYSSEASK